MERISLLIEVNLRKYVSLFLLHTFYGLVIWLLTCQTEWLVLKSRNKLNIEMIKEKWNSIINCKGGVWTWFPALRENIELNSDYVRDAILVEAIFGLCITTVILIEQLAYSGLRTSGTNLIAGYFFFSSTWWVITWKKRNNDMSQSIPIIIASIYTRS